jgi:hypothetical protein
MKTGGVQIQTFSMTNCDASRMSDMLPIPPPIETPWFNSHQIPLYQQQLRNTYIKKNELPQKANGTVLSFSFSEGTNLHLSMPHHLHREHRNLGLEHLIPSMPRSPPAQPGAVAKQLEHHAHQLLILHLVHGRRQRVPSRAAAPEAQTPASLPASPPASMKVVVIPVMPNNAGPAAPGGANWSSRQRGASVGFSSSRYPRSHKQ